MSHDGKTELRFELPTQDLATVDGYCNATGKSRTDVLRGMVAEWAEKKRHEATVICRVTGINPFTPESTRQQG
jgi:hypothetical protein